MPVHIPLSRSKDTQTQTHAHIRPSNAAASSSPSSSSLSSSLSSVASSLLFPAGSFSNSSRSDIAPSLPDRSQASLHPSIKNRLFPLHIIGPPRSSSLASMGQSLSTRPPAITYAPTSLPAAPPTPVHSPATPSPPSSISLSVGSRIKRAWGARRKKSEDISATFAHLGGDASVKGKDRAPVESYYATPPESISEQANLRPGTPSSRPSPAPRCGTLAVTIPPALDMPFGSTIGQSPKSLKFSGSPPVPPPVPPKSASPLPAPTVPVSQQALAEAPTPSDELKRKVLPSEDTPSGNQEQVEQSNQDNQVISRQKSNEDQEKLKEIWRKSDATVTSYVTVRPGALAGNRSPRPVSLAESSHSGHTVVPVNKRLSALITDAEFTMFEEGDNTDAEQEVVVPISVSGRPSPTGSMKGRNRRSVSLSLSPGFATKFKADPSSKSPLNSPGRLTNNDPKPGFPSLTSTHDSATLTRAAAAGYISPLNTSDLGSAAAGSGTNIRTRLAAWTAPATPVTPVGDERRIPPPLLPSHPPVSHQRRLGARPGGSLAPPSFRQTAVSMTGSLAPAAGFAKRAVEKVGKAWGGFNSSSSTHSGYSSSSSVETHASSSRAKRSDHSHSSHSRSNARSNEHGEHSAFGLPQSMGGGWKKRRGHHGFSGSSSISSVSSSNTSEHDHFVPTGPTLGKCIRGPNQTPSGSRIVGGLVFRRDLQSCVRETATDRVLLHLQSREGGAQSDVKIKPLEERSLPALAMRCAQHISKWGIQEEGLFRYDIMFD